MRCGAWWGWPVVMLAVLMVVRPGASGAEERFRSPDILVLGDSQLSFGAGEAFVDFFRDLGADCGLSAGMSVGVIGVRSSSLEGFTAQRGAARGAICDVDARWRVNAGVYGVLGGGKTPYRQIGQGREYQFCQPGQTPFQAMFGAGYYMPRLLVLFFLGNATDRWAGSVDAAVQDVRRTVRDLPADLPCVFMTTAPPFAARTVRARQKAQDNVARAFAATGGRCAFVAGLTPQTVAANQGNAASFRRKASGMVKDPYHPTQAAAVRFLSLRRTALCRAIAGQMARGG